MADGQLRAVIGQLRRLIGAQGGSSLTDTQLLEAFVNRRDEAAFEVLVWRHGTMIFNLCQRILHDAHQAEDAFQATFLVFVRKAATIDKRESLGSWLYKVAYRIACRARIRSARNVPSVADAGLNEPERRSAEDDVLWRDLRPVLDEEINRLPEKYRAPFVLCHLQGHTNEEAAQLLGCPKGTILSRLSRGRERLRSRLVQRGLALTVAWLTTQLSVSASSAAVPAALVSGTVKVSLPFAAGLSATGLVSTSVASLTDSVLHAMFLAKVKMTAAALLTLAMFGAGAGTVAHWASAAAQAPNSPIAQAPPQDPPVQQEKPQEPKPDLTVPPAYEQPQNFTGKVVTVPADGKSFIVEIPAQERGAEARSMAVSINSKTSISYNGVAPGGARPTEGYTASVRLEKGEAVSVLFQAGESTRSAPDRSGKVAVVARGEKGFTLEEGPLGRERNEVLRKTELRFNDKTQLVFAAVAAGGARPTAGYRVQVWLTDDPAGNIVAKAQFTGPENLFANRKDPGPDLSGKVVAVSRDGKVISLSVSSRNADREQSAVAIKFEEGTAVIYQNVPAGGARISEGQHAAIWLAPGSKDKAVKVGITGVVPERWQTVSGNLIGVAEDGSTITLETRTPPVRGGTRSEPRAEALKKMDIRLTPQTRLIFQGVGPNEARLTVGFAAVVRLADDSRDTALQIVFTKAGPRDR